MKKYFAGCSNYGKLIMLIGVLVALPLIVLPFYPEEIKYIPAFLIPSVLSVALGLVVCILTSGQEESVTEWQSPLQKGSQPVMFSWCFAIFLGAIPFVLSGQEGFLHALFESVSGWTTTGLTVVDIANTPNIFLFHRSFMQYCGGVGFIIMIAMIVHVKQAMNLYYAEGHPDRLMPSLKRTAQAIFLLYNGFLLVGTILYRIFGMGLFDAVCHTMSALSTAGYSTRVGSIGEYESLSIEIVTILLMLIGSTNFAILMLLVKRKFRQVFNIAEIRFVIGLLIVFVPLIAISLNREVGLAIGESFHEALFGVVTTFSTTGYSTMNYAEWPAFTIGLLILLMIIGGGAGSTAGGIKLSRTYLLIKITRENIRKRISPARCVTTPSYYSVQGKTLIDDALVKDIFGFVSCYMGVLIVGTLLITLTAGCSLLDALFEFASAFGTVGISNGLTNSSTDAATLVVEMAGMLLGRLEIFIVFVGASSIVRTIKRWLRKIIRIMATIK